MKVFERSSRASASSMPTAEKLPGSGGMTTVRNRQFARQRARMQRPAAAIAEQHEFARVEAMLDGDLLDRARHDDGRDRDRCRPPCGSCRRSPVKPSGAGDALDGARARPSRRASARRRGNGRDRGGRARDWRRSRSARCRRGRSRPAPASSRRFAGRHAAGFCGSSQAIEPPPEPTSTMSMTERLDRKALHIAAGVIDRFHREAAVLDQRAFRGGAAHVEGDDVRRSRALRRKRRRRCSRRSGPDSTSATGCRQVRSTESRPPFEPIMKSEPAKPLAPQVASRAAGRSGSPAARHRRWRRRSRCARTRTIRASARC